MAACLVGFEQFFLSGVGGKNSSVFLVAPCDPKAVVWITQGTEFCEAVSVGAERKKT